jgi:hypothetical protein
MKKILFLDIDGVLNSFKNEVEHTCKIDKKLVENLNTILKSVPDLRIIISSSWKMVGLKELKERFSGHIDTERVIGITSDFATREEEILAYVHKNKIEKWTAIDDCPLSLSPENFVKTCSKNGLTTVKAKEVILKVNV